MKFRQAYTLGAFLLFLGGVGVGAFTGQVTAWGLALVGFGVYLWGIRD